MTGGSAIVVVPPEVASGFRLAGVTTIVAATPAEAAAAIDGLVMEHTEGVVAVYEPYLGGLAPDVAARFDRSLAPVIVPLPSGRPEPAGDTRRARIADMLTRAVGYQVTFGTKEE